PTHAHIYAGPAGAWKRNTGRKERKKWHEGPPWLGVWRATSCIDSRIKPSMQKELKDRRAYREKTGNVSPYRGTRPHRRQML
ncbi:hypothetical protein ACLBYN_42250, partial [Pseudomonas aeruginosa]